MSNNVDLSATLESLRATAIAQVARHPQYRNHFASYRLVRIKSEVKTKAGLAFARGEFALATVWSRRNQVDTSVRVTAVEWL